MISLCSCASERTAPIGSPDICFEVLRLRDFQARAKSSGLDSSRKIEVQRLVDNRIGFLGRKDGLDNPDASCKSFTGKSDKQEHEGEEGNHSLIVQPIVRFLFGIFIENLR